VLASSPSTPRFTFTSSSLARSNPPCTSSLTSTTSSCLAPETAWSTWTNLAQRFVFLFYVCCFLSFIGF
jgi:hypothetical protein